MSRPARFFLRVLALAGKEVRHIVRDPRSLYMALGMPVVMLLLFGFGVSFDLDHLPIAVVDQDVTHESRELTRHLTANDAIDLVAEPASVEAAEELFMTRDAVAIVVIEHGFAEDLARGRAATVQVLVDGADNNTAVQARAKIEATLRAAAQSLVLPEGASMAATGANGGLPIAPRISTRFNPEQRSAVYLVPGIVAYILAIVAVMLTALTVSREWERGSMAQLFATPVGRLEIVLGKLAPYLVLGFVSVLLVVAVGGWVFDVPFRGSALALGLLSFLFILGMLGQGLLISVLARNQMVATQAAAMSSMLPSMLLSGFVFPIENMPEVLQWVSAAIPARYLVSGLRGVLLKGNGLAEVWPDMIPLAVFALLMIVVSTARFRRTVA